jgi:TPR repeat protein
MGFLNVIKPGMQTANDFKQAAKHGNKEAQYNLGQCYLYGLGVEKDLKEAALWLGKSANLGKVHIQNILTGLIERHQREDQL